MKLIFLYGPPATGKLTVAKELEKKLNYKIFHNHLTYDLVKSVIDKKAKLFWKYVGKYRLEFIEIAAKNKTKGLIFTFCYDKGNDDKFVKKVLDIVEKNKGKVLFVHLYCNKEELRKRVKNESRKQYHKLKSIKGLNRSLKTYNFFEQVPFKEGISIDNTSHSPKKVAKLIINHYNLN